MKFGNYLILGLALANVYMFISCSQDDLFVDAGEENQHITNTSTRTVGDTLLAERFEDNIDSWAHSEYYVDAPGNIYGIYSKGYVDFLALSNEWSQISEGIGYVSGIDIGGKPCYGFCLDLNENTYYITSNNRLLKQNRAQQIKDLTDSFPENTVFLGITGAQVNANIFVATAQGDGTDNPWQSYSRQTIYRIAGNGNVTLVAENIHAPVVPNAPYMVDYGAEEKMFVYTSVLSKRQGAFLYGMDANKKYYMVNTNTGEVEYYTPKVPIQFLTAGTSSAKAIALSGRQILELRPYVAKDLVIGYLPDLIPEDAKVMNFYTNADATIFYVVVLQEFVSDWSGGTYLNPTLYRLRVAN